MDEQALTTEVYLCGDSFQFNVPCMSCGEVFPVMIETVMVSGKNIIPCSNCNTEQVLKHKLLIDIELSEIRKIQLVPPAKVTKGKSGTNPKKSKK